MDSKTLTHLNEQGEARMVDVGGKEITARRAVAQGRIVMQPSTLDLIATGGHSKGDVLAVARIAAIMATKRTQEFPVSSAFSDARRSDSGLIAINNVSFVRLRPKPGSAPALRWRRSTVLTRVF